METQISAQIDILKKVLRDKFNARQIIIFGSRAYGEPELSSDIDLCIITDLKNKRKIDLIREIRRELYHLISIPFDILVYSESEFYERADIRSTFEYKIQKDGLKIYG